MKKCLILILSLCFVAFPLFGERIVYAKPIESVIGEPGQVREIKPEPEPQIIPEPEPQIKPPIQEGIDGGTQTGSGSYSGTDSISTGTSTSGKSTTSSKTESTGTMTPEEKKKLLEQLTKEQEDQESGSSIWLYVVIGVVGAGAVGTGVYFLIKKLKNGKTQW